MTGLEKGMLLVFLKSQLMIEEAKLKRATDIVPAIYYHIIKASINEIKRQIKILKDDEK